MNKGPRRKLWTNFSAKGRQPLLDRTEYLKLAARFSKSELGGSAEKILNQRKRLKPETVRVLDEINNTQPSSILQATKVLSTVLKSVYPKTSFDCHKESLIGYLFVGGKLKDSNAKEANFTIRIEVEKWASRAAFMTSVDCLLLRHRAGAREFNSYDEAVQEIENLLEQVRWLKIRHEEY